MPPSVEPGKLGPENVLAPLVLPGWSRVREVSQKWDVFSQNCNLAIPTVRVAQIGHPYTSERHLELPALCYE
jgi:hypothetical protein